MGGQTFDDDVIESDESTAPGATELDRGPLRLAIVVGASGVAAGIGAAMVIYGPMIAGWYVLVAATWRSPQR